MTVLVYRHFGIAAGYTAYYRGEALHAVRLHIVIRVHLYTGKTDAIKNAAARGSLSQHQLAFERFNIP
ncbi:Uncharacterised protein [Enterobacter cloacae]|nr:Uncharacterised protein [Enterobacter cloacae]